MKKQVGDDVKRLTNSYNQLKTKPIELPTIKFKKYEELFPQLGKLLDVVVIPDNCEVTGIPAQLIAGNKLDFTIITKNHNNDRCCEGGSHIVAKAQPSRGDDVPVEVKDNNDGSYSASLLTKQEGEVKLSITIEGIHVRGSPYAIMVYRDYKTEQEPKKIMNNNGNWGGPVNIAFGKDGVCVVTDHIKHCVHVYDNQGGLIRQLSRGNGQFQYPWGVSFDAYNEFYVAEYGNNQVQKFRIDGTYLLQFGRHGSGDGQLSGPSGVTGHNDKVFVADRNNHRVSVFDLNGQFSCTVGSGHLSSPHDVAVTADDQLLVAQYKNNCVFKFTLDGMYVDKFGDGHLSHPGALAIDLHGIILVGECGNNRVSVFDKDGAFMHTFGSYGSAGGQFSNPYGIAISPNNDVYIADYGNKRIQIF